QRGYHEGRHCELLLAGQGDVSRVSRSDVLLDNPLLDVGEAKKVVNSKGRPRNTATFSAKEKSIHDRAQGVSSRKTAHNTSSLGSKKGDKTGKTSSSSQRIISAGYLCRRALWS
ncbi:hypothetical protein GcC1_104024, partial [Golovinomyces cichoracearum]